MSTAATAGYCDLATGQCDTNEPRRAHGDAEAEPCDNVGPLDLIINAGTRPIAARDYGGTGSSLLLLHGAGENLASMTPLAHAFAVRHRVVSIDLRGHGLSAEGDWAFDGVLDDLEMVIDTLGLGNPAVVGHSLGGMVAAAWGHRHPEVPGVVNLDGNPLPNSIDDVPGLSPEFAVEQLARFRESLGALFAGFGSGLTPEAMAAMESGQRATAAAAGLDSEDLLESLHRRVAQVNGELTIRPSTWTLGRLTTGQGEFDLIDAYRNTTSPLLVVSGTRGLPMHDQFPEMWHAFRESTNDRLDAVAAITPSMRHVVLQDSAHTMYYDDVTRVVALVEEFLAAP
jgi:pimeloyl-ACP methyl ester carboxylesterase